MRGRPREHRFHGAWRALFAVGVVCGVVVLLARGQDRATAAPVPTTTASTPDAVYYAPRLIAASGSPPPPMPLVTTGRRARSRASDAAPVSHVRPARKAPTWASVAEANRRANQKALAAAKRRLDTTRAGAKRPPAPRPKSPPKRARPR
ncbi:MAG: hypothetical protein IT373_18640 [Polyangiaceae bacterium]|nr:hypothetical protein [Polyangiaceae bacterium]